MKMKTSRLAEILAAFAVAILAAVLAGCGTLSPGGGADDPCKHAMYDGKTGMVPFIDAARGFRLCVPGQLTRTGPAGFPDGRVVFAGFAVPPGTNLEAKTLIIVSGSYDELQGATPAGRLAAGGETFQRVEVDEGSAGHSTLHVIYTWKNSGKTVHFDFTHLAVNPLVYDPAQRPATYDRAAQIKLTEEIMRTFARVH